MNLNKFLMFKENLSIIGFFLISFNVIGFSNFDSQIAISVNHFTSEKIDFNIAEIRSDLKEVLTQIVPDMDKPSRDALRAKFVSRLSKHVTDYPEYKNLIYNEAYKLCASTNVSWLVSEENGKVVVREVTNGEFKEYREAKSAMKPTEVFKVVEQMPCFPGCESLEKLEKGTCAQKKMLEFIYQNIEYPEEARKKGVEGMVIIRFIVRKDGELTNLEAIREIGAGTTEAALKVVQAMPTWNPGMQRGKPVDVQFNIPIKFKLEKSTSKISKKKSKKRSKKD